MPGARALRRRIGMIFQHFNLLSSKYVNVLVAREDDQDAPALKKLAAALRGAAVKEFIQTQCHGAVVPAF